METICNSLEVQCLQQRGLSPTSGTWVLFVPLCDNK